jgi:hypothetical protein
MTGAEWFKHDADMSADEKVIYLESQFGLVGYALFNKMLEALARAHGNKLPWNDIQCGIYARKFGCEVATFRDFIREATRPEIAAFVVEDGMLFSPGLHKRLTKLYERREREAERIARKRKQPQLAATDDDVAPTVHQQPPMLSNVAATDAQSRVEYSRVEKSRTHPPTPAGEMEMPEALKVLKGFAQEWEKWESERKPSMGAARSQLETLLEHFANGYDPRKIVKFSVEADFRALARPTDDMKFPVRTASQGYQPTRRYVSVEMPEGGINPHVLLESLDFNRAEHLREKSILTYDEYQLLKKTNAPNTS